MFCRTTFPPAITVTSSIAIDTFRCGWITAFNRGVHLFRKLVHAFYTPEFSFADFIKRHPQYQGNLTDLLIGRAFYDGAERIFTDLDPAVAAAQQMDTGPTR